jgi:hypothetical protein
MALQFRNLGGNPYTGLMSTASRTFADVGNAYMGIGQAKFNRNMAEARYQAQREEEERRREDARYNNMIDTAIKGVGMAMQYDIQQDKITQDNQLKRLQLEDSSFNLIAKSLTPQAQARLIENRNAYIDKIYKGENVEFGGGSYYGADLKPEDFRNKDLFSAKDLKDVAGAYKSLSDVAEESNKRILDKYLDKYGVSSATTEGEKYIAPYSEIKRLFDNEKTRYLVPRGYLADDSNLLAPNEVETREEFFAKNGFREIPTWEEFSSNYKKGGFGYIQNVQRNGQVGVQREINTLEDDEIKREYNKLGRSRVQSTEGVSLDENSSMEEIMDSLSNIGIGGADTSGKTKEELLSLFNSMKEGARNIAGYFGRLSPARQGLVQQDVQDIDAQPQTGSFSGMIAEPAVETSATVAEIKQLLDENTKPLTDAQRGYDLQQKETTVDSGQNNNKGVTLQPVIQPATDKSQTISGRQLLKGDQNVDTSLISPLSTEDLETLAKVRNESQEELNAKLAESASNQKVTEVSSEMASLEQIDPNISSKYASANPIKKSEILAFTAPENPDGNIGPNQKQAIANLLNYKYLKGKSKVNESDILNALDDFKQDAFNYHLGNSPANESIEEATARATILAENATNQAKLALPNIKKDFKRAGEGGFVFGDPQSLLDEPLIISMNKERPKGKDTMPVITFDESEYGPAQSDGTDYSGFDSLLSGMKGEINTSIKKETNNETVKTAPILTEVIDSVAVDESDTDGTPPSVIENAKKALETPTVTMSTSDLIATTVELGSEIPSVVISPKGKKVDVEVSPVALSLITLSEAQQNDNGELVVNYVNPNDGGSRSVGLGQIKDSTLEEVNKRREANGLEKIPVKGFKENQKDQLRASDSYIKLVIVPELKDRLGDKFEDLSPKEKLVLIKLRYTGGIVYDDKNPAGFRKTDQGKINETNFRALMERQRDLVTIYEESEEEKNSFFSLVNRFLRGPAEAQAEIR